MDTIFTVTGIDERGGTHPLSTRCFGWYPSEKLASNSIVKNAGDMHECKYIWLVVEEFPWGSFSTAKKETWWEWIEDVKDGFWQRCDKPKCIRKDVINWGMA